MRRPVFTYANVTATLALVIALTGGTAYAATMITSKQIKNGTIRGVDIRNSTIPGTKLVAGSIPGSTLAAGTIPAPYAGTAAYSTFHEAGVSVQNRVSGHDPVVLTLSVPAGSYVLNATTVLDNNQNSAVPALCTLAAGGDSDYKFSLLEAYGTDKAIVAPLALQTVHTFTAPGVATLSCYGSGADVHASNSRLTAIKVDHLSNVAG